MKIVSLINTKLLYKNQVISTKLTKVIQYFFFYILQGKDREFWILLIPTFTKCSIISDLHYLWCWNLHKMSVTKFDSVGKKHRPAACAILYLFKNVLRGVKSLPQKTEIGLNMSCWHYRFQKIGSVCASHQNYEKRKIVNNTLNTMIDTA